jgi:hypothetical protein
VNRIHLALALLVAAGCQSRLTGNEGNFVFVYDADDDYTDFNKPIAVNAFLDIEVREVGTELPVTLTSASTDDPSVLDVTGTLENVATLQGMGDGGALLSVEGTTSDGETLPDSVNLLAATPEVHKLGHTCTLDDTAGYLVSNSVYVPFEFQKENGQNIIGYGYYPVTAQEGAVILDEAGSSQQYMLFDVGAAPAAETLVSDIDGTSVAMTIVQASALDGVEEPIAGVIEDIDVGDTNPFYVRPTVGGTTVCQADTTKTVVSDTPAICDVRDAAAPINGKSYEYGWFEIGGVSQGTCLYTVTFDAGNDGAGASAQFSFEIQP